MDLDGDGRIDLVMAQFAGPTFVLRNETENGVVRLVENTPPQISTSPAMRVQAFDANGDGIPDLVIGHDTPNVGLSLIIGNVPEKEPNESIAQAHALSTFPALLTGIVDRFIDKDVFALPARALSEGTRVRLKPAANADLKLTLLDAGGNVIATSQNVGNGVTENLDAPVGSGGMFLRVELQSGLANASYRLEIDVLP